MLLGDSYLFLHSSYWRVTYRFIQFFLEYINCTGYIASTWVCATATGDLYVRNTNSSFRRNIPKYARSLKSWITLACTVQIMWFDRHFLPLIQLHCNRHMQASGWEEFHLLLKATLWQMLKSVSFLKVENRVRKTDNRNLIIKGTEKKVSNFDAIMPCIWPTGSTYDASAAV